jgi:hypothetical protein
MREFQEFTKWLQDMLEGTVQSPPQSKVTPILTSHKLFQNLTFLDLFFNTNLLKQ